MKPPYNLTDKMMHLVVSISEKIGAINANHLYKPSTELRKKKSYQNDSGYTNDWGKYNDRRPDYGNIGK